MNDLSKLEYSILERLTGKYPQIKKHIPYLQVKSRKTTGVGMYINFCYSDHEIVPLSLPDGPISTNETIQIKGLRYGLGYEVDISNGRLNFIEVVTYGEEWNGIVGDFEFKENT